MAGEQRKLISVIVPVYKVEQWLRPCMESILHQTYRNLEIILVDDGSPDRCGRICDALAREDARIVVIHKENGGLSDARNRGLDRATGEYLAFVDSDDYLEPDMLETLADGLEQEHADMAVCNYQNDITALTGQLENVEPESSYQIQEKMVLTGEEFIRLQRKKTPFCVVVWNKLYRRELWDQVRFPVGKIHEDSFIFFKVAYPCRKILCDPYVGYNYRMLNDSIMGRGGSLLDLLEAVTMSSSYFADHSNRELALDYEREMLYRVMQCEIHQVRLKINPEQLQQVIQKCVQLEKRLYCKGWVSWPAWYTHRMLLSPLGKKAAIILRKCKKVFPSVYQFLKGKWGK